MDYNSSRMKGVFTPSSCPYDLSSSARSQTSVIIGDGGEQIENRPIIGGSVLTGDGKQVMINNLFGILGYLC